MASINIDFGSYFTGNTSLLHCSIRVPVCYLLICLLSFIRITQNTSAESRNFRFETLGTSNILYTLMCCINTNFLQEHIETYAPVVGSFTVHIKSCNAQATGCRVLSEIISPCRPISMHPPSQKKYILGKIPYPL